MILKYADAVIIVRNELNFELPPDKLMVAQKWMVQTANMESVPVFIQSQVLESMTCLLYTSPSPRDRQKSRMPSSA